MAADYDLFPMFVKAQILAAAILTAGAVCTAEPLVTDTVFVAFDTETTGFSPKNDRIIEIGAVRFRGNGEVLASTNWLINPAMPVPFYATEVNGVTTEMVAGAPAFKEIFPQFAAFCRGTVLLAHNAAFDTGFLRAELERAGILPPAFPIGDTLPLFRRWFPQAQSHALEPLSIYLGVQGGDYHRAEADSFHIISIFNEGMKSRRALTVEQLERDAGGFQSFSGGQR